MACCLARDPWPPASDGGYATPAALILALGLALLATAMVGRSVMLLRQARADLQRMQVAAVLDGAHLQAAARVVRAGAGGPFHWALASESGWIDVRVEAEAEKLSPLAASGLSDSTLAAFDVTDPETLRRRLQTWRPGRGEDVGGLDAAPLWRACAASLISPFGLRTRFSPALAHEPAASAASPAWRIGELWRVRLTTSAGWRDDRIVRFTGDARRPVAVVVRRLSRSDKGQGQCDAALAAA